MSRTHDLLKEHMPPLRSLCRSYSVRRPIVATLGIWFVLSTLYAIHPACLVRVHAGEISYDRYSLIIGGKRVVIFSGEFHYWRLPSPSLWPDILQKIRASGYNAVRIVFPWSYHSPAPGVYDFEGIRDIGRLLEECKRNDLYVLAVPGPYICAETDAGGFPGWLLERSLYLRCLDGFIVPRAHYDAEYVQTWSRQWFSKILPILARYQITQEPAGPVILVQIENEYPESLFRVGTLRIVPGIGDRRYIEELVAMAREYGIDVPLFHNDVPPAGSWDDIVDISAFDLYPYIGGVPGPGAPPWGTRNTFQPLLDHTEELVRSYGGPSAHTPLFVAEFQGGWYAGWGSAGYDGFYDFFGPEYFTILDKSMLGQGFTLINRYMFYGGTNWGYLSNPEVYTSYDYSAAIREWGVLSTKYSAMKKVAMFVEAFPELVTATESLFENPDGTHPWLTFLRNGDAAEDMQTSVRVQWDGSLHRIPKDPNMLIPLYMRSMRILVSNYQMENIRLLYSTFELLTRLGQEHTTILCVYGRQGEQGEIAFGLSQEPQVTFLSTGFSWTYDESSGQFLIRGTLGSRPSFAAFVTADTNEVWKIVFLDELLAGQVWRCDLRDRQVLIIGPYLGRNEHDRASLQEVGPHSGSCAIWINAPTDVYVLPVSKARSVTLKGSNRAFDKVAELDLFHTHIHPGEVPGVPRLGLWRFKADTPEADPQYDDTSWVEIPEGESLSPDRYGFHYGFVWYRGHYRTEELTLPLAIAIDARHSYSVYWNGTLLGSHTTYSDGVFVPGAAGTPDLFPDVCILRIPRYLVRHDNTIAVLTESLGHNKGYAMFPDIANPRGIITCRIIGDPHAAIKWKIRGQGEDPEAELFNSSGLNGELNGYYRSDFDDTRWQMIDLPHDWDTDPLLGEWTTGIGWYRTTFELDVPDDVQFPLGLFIGKACSKALVWLNGRLVGRFWEQMGPQRMFYLPQGVLDYHNENVLALCVWRMADDKGMPDPGVVEDIRIEPYPLDHRVSGVRSQDASVDNSPFCARRYDIVVSYDDIDENTRDFSDASQGWCGACSATQRKGPDGSHVLFIGSVAGWILYMKIRLTIRWYSFKRNALRHYRFL